MAGSTPRTPGSRAIENLQAVDEFKKPLAAFSNSQTLPKNKVKPKILTEEKYIDELSRIIQRDFFPDLEKLRAQNDYLDAESRKDYVHMAAIRSKYSGGLPLSERGRSMTPSTFETPASAGSYTPMLRGDVNCGTPKSIASVKSTSSTATSCSKTVSSQHTLDSFLHHYTSEDNQSFQEIIETAEAKLRQKFAVLYNQEQLSADKLARALTLPTIDRQFEQPDPMRTIETWTYKNMNSVMYIPDGVEMGEQDRLKAAECRQIIKHSATRLQQNQVSVEMESQEGGNMKTTMASEGRTATRSSDREILNTPNHGRKIRGFDLIKTPSPRPGECFSPLMTWGEIEGTPFRLDGGDTPLRSNAGPSFKITENSRRENIAIALAEKVGVKMRAQKQQAMDTARKNIGSPFIRSNMERLSTMSPAARQLATGKLGLRNSPLSMTPSPLSVKQRGTPNLVKTNNCNRNDHRYATPIGNGNNKKENKRGSNKNSETDTGTSLTDDLLKIPTKRLRATDFF